MLNHYLGPYVLNIANIDRDARISYDMPKGCYSSVNIGKINEVPWGLFSLYGELSSEYRHMGKGDPREIHLKERDKLAWSSALKIGRVYGNNLAEILVETWTRLSDPKGLNAIPPLMPTRDKIFEIWIANTRIYSEGNFDIRNNSHHRDVVRDTYRKALNLVQIGVMDKDFHRRTLDILAEKYLGEMYEVEQAQLHIIPPDLDRSETPLPHETTYTDSFTYSDGDLDTVSSGAWGLSDASTIGVASNIAVSLTSPPSSDRVFAAWTTALGADHYSQIVGADSNNKIFYASTRVSSNSGLGIGTCYGALYDSSSGTWSVKRYLNTGLAASMIGGTTDSGLHTATLYLKSEGGTHTIKLNGITLGSTSDSNLPSNLYVGFGMQIGGGAATVKLDNWEGGDLPPDESSSSSSSVTSSSSSQTSSSSSSSQTSSSSSSSVTSSSSSSVTSSSSSITSSSSSSQTSSSSSSQTSSSSSSSATSSSSSSVTSSSSSSSITSSSSSSQTSSSSSSSQTSSSSSLTSSSSSSGLASSSSSLTSSSSSSITSSSSSSVTSSSSSSSSSATSSSSSSQTSSSSSSSSSVTSSSSSSATSSSSSSSSTSSNSSSSSSSSVTSSSSSSSSSVTSSSSSSSVTSSSSSFVANMFIPVSATITQPT